MDGTDVVILIVKALLSFLIGAIAFAKVAMVGTGIDITKAGSKNPGFNNVLRVTGNWWRAGIALVGDISKGFLALLLLSPGEGAANASWVIGVAAVMGHCWSPFLKFNGGKGVATTVGVLLFLEPWLTLASLPLYPILRFIGRRLKWPEEGAIASLTTMTLLATLVFLYRGPEPAVFAFFLLAVVIIRHIPNLRKICNPA